MPAGIDRPLCNVLPPYIAISYLHVPHTLLFRRCGRRLCAAVCGKGSVLLLSAVYICGTRLNIYAAGLYIFSLKVQQSLSLTQHTPHIPRSSPVAVAAQQQSSVIIVSSQYHTSHPLSLL